MESLSQREVRNHSDEVLRRLAEGEPVMVTNNGGPAVIWCNPATGLARRRAAISR